MDELLMLNVSVTDMNEQSEYTHQKSKELLEGVRNLFQNELKIFVPEYISEKIVLDEMSQEVNRIADIFFIGKCNEPIYAACNCADDREVILKLFENRLSSLYYDLEALTDNNVDLEAEIIDSLESYLKAVDKCIKVYNTQRKKRASKFKEMSTVDELRDELKQFFTEIISNYIISVLFDGLYQRLSNGASQIYKMVVKEVNRFLAENGIYTKSISVGEMIDPEYMEPTPDSKNNVTDDYQKFDAIEEIRRYPYMFSDDSKVIDGCVRIWRRKD